MRVTLGGQYDVTPTVTVGAVMRTRGWGLTSGGMAMLEGVPSTSSTTATASFFDDGATPSTAVYPASPLVVDSRTVTNIAIGGQYNLTSNGAWIVHGGYGTDRLPVGDQDTMFTKANLQKFSVGISARTTHFLGSFGVHQVTGVSEPVILRELPSGQVSTKFHLSSLGLVCSLSVLF